MKKAIRYSIIVPVYNEEAVINETYQRLTKVMESMGEPYELLFINDGSRDKTAQIIEQLAEADDSVKLLDFSRNFGHQIAITAGMDYACGEAVVIIDADLQDPPELIPQMAAKWQEGFEVVYAKRTKRKGETLFKKWTAALFYRTLRAAAEIDIPLDTGDFRLMDRKVCEAMRSIREKNRFVRGLVSWVGFRQTAIEYTRDERFAGETKYPLKKMLRFSMDGITSFSYKPLKLAGYLGFVVSFSSFVYLIVTLFLRLFTADTIPGWSSVMACVLLLNGVVLIILGILGEYVGRIYDETKNRPLYILRNKEHAGRPQPDEVNWRVKQ
ncbi:glycosyltransferase family 2 protein [Aneurinibacillus sp. Ricciae_BoGa-3]|uniref:glycosyltransferase family 2 protein n=1 Tax=Aneurinibacillus sp. Ricciae_BoGa-3 TaxID=3022697 RepID=UPI0023413173|nr:glycosyltransferase family 2 protein [Aneurinibacillus sp. Ricciae_BoGa-3]WCK55635.1 glycosyltransferase family 2 protein [Aneurinibacillus sp. Ricciae_BoGa-3]